MSTVSNPATGLSSAIPIPPAMPTAPPVVQQESLLRQIPSAQPYRFTVEQIERMITSGVLGKYDRCELIRGELIQKMTIGDPHAAAVRRLIRFFKRVRDDEALIGAQDAVKLFDSRPEPDFTLLVPRDDCYASGTARPADILLLVEVSDSSLEMDRAVKLPLYAENSIQEYWIVNLIDDCLEVHRQPQGLDYAQRFVVRRGESVSPLALPALSVTAEMLLGEPLPAAPAG